MRQTRIDTLFKTQNQNKTPHSEEKQKPTRITFTATSRKSCGHEGKQYETETSQ